MAVPNQLPKINVSELPADFAIHYSNMIDRVNSLMGHNGVIELGNHVSLGGKRIMQVGAPVESTDALPSAQSTRRIDERSSP